MAEQFADQSSGDDGEPRVILLRDKDKDHWDIASAVGGLFVPVVIAAAGLNVSHSTERAAEELGKQQLENARAIAAASANVSKADILLQSLEALAGDNGPKKTLAAEAVMMALPDRGPDLMKKIAAGATDEATQIAVEEAVVAQRERSIKELYDSSTATSSVKTDEFLDGWSEDEKAIGGLVETVKSNLKQPKSRRARQWNLQLIACAGRRGHLANERRSNGD